MKKYQAAIIVRLKNGVRDPQGSAIETVLKRIKTENATVRAGKFFSILIDANNLEQAREKIEEISSEILSNPILEEYEILRVEEL